VNAGGLGSPAIDQAFDRVRRAASDQEYRDAVVKLQQTFVDDPPAVFLAWTDRIRAISNRFVVSTPEPGRDILSTLRLWKPVAAESRLGHN
jgi:hypothetical protein